MSTRKQTDCESNEAWVELHLQHTTTVTEPSIWIPQESIHDGSLEKLLIDAQHESCAASRTNSKEPSAGGSPRSSHSPSTEWSIGEWQTKQDPGTDWIWDWSSGPEVQPMSDWGHKFRHPIGKPRFPSARIPKSTNTKPSFFHLDNLPTLLLTHACTFVFGAALMFIYLKKYCNWNVVVPQSLE